MSVMESHRSMDLQLHKWQQKTIKRPFWIDLQPKFHQMTPKSLRELSRFSKMYLEATNVAQVEPRRRPKSQKGVAGRSKGVPKGVQKRLKNGPWAQTWDSEKTKSEIVLRLERERHLGCQIAFSLESQRNREK
jgi:hypothetical protein